MLCALLALWACIKPFDPEIDGNRVSKYVVSGRITDEEGWQEVSVSVSSSINNPGFIAVPGCLVIVLDDKGNYFRCDDYSNGTYRVWMDQENLAYGTRYKVVVINPEGDTIESSYDRLQQGPPLDSVYYILEDKPTSNPDVFHRGMQFYVDLKAEGYDSRYYKWDVVETWEFHTAHAAEYYYDGEFHQIIPPDSSNMVCWSTGLVKNVYTISTKSLSQNAYHQYPLHFVDGSSSRLGILYSILVRQLTIGEEAYNYWEQLRVLTSDQGGLYEKQPLAVKGNLVNTTSPDKQVLGYFYAASVASRRYFYTAPGDIELTFTNFCNEEELGYGGWRKFRYYDYPVYYYYSQFEGLRLLNRECVDCRIMGGVTTKPDFWPLSNE